MAEALIVVLVTRPTIDFKKKIGATKKRYGIEGRRKTQYIRFLLFVFFVFFVVCFS